MKKSFFYSLLLVGVNSVIVFLICYKMMSSSIVYVDGEKLFSEFKMTKELKKMGEHELQLKTAKLDSLQILISATKNENLRSILMRDYIRKQQEFEVFQTDYTALNSKKIWKRIKSYSEEYAKLMGYDFIFMSNSNQTILTGSKSKSITVELLNYIDKKYEGYQ